MEWKRVELRAKRRTVCLVQGGKRRRGDKVQRSRAECPRASSYK